MSPAMCPVEDNPYDDEQLRKIREEQEDPLVMYLIIKKSLNMTAGKIGPQCAHAAQMTTLKYMNDIQYPIPGDHDQLDRTKLYRDWMKESFRKILKEAKDSHFEKVKEDCYCFVVRDAGLTQVEPGSETVIAVWPMRRSQTPKFIHRMRLVE